MASPKYLTIEYLTQAEHECIFSKISVDPKTECWNWLGSTSVGYGKVWFRGRRAFVHRLMYAWLIEPIPMGVHRDIPVLDHIVCDNPQCCNPRHLTLSTHRENVLRGNGPSGINSRKTHCPKGHSLPNKPNRANGKRYCTICNGQYERSEEQKERRRQKAQKYYRLHRKEILKKCAAYRRRRKTDKDATDKLREYQKEYRIRNREKIRKYQREYARRRRREQSESIT